ncbi:MAG: tRNA (adenosine(37)-N6)-threonylcarbamoyltransferase complex transferase subunit TsaD [Nitrospinae bacterium]|nr:tRNA (adenosine(37)-N6)-threonylcarbamoyltransferase complex transferase subunit TsaD [Nitrospinota bacterium]
MILAIDTSCDDTSAAVVTTSSQVLSNIISSQIDLHKPFGGVVPELACRFHVEYIDNVVQKALDTANVSLDEITSIAPTVGPGLSPALLIGISFSKGLAESRDIFLLPQNHIESHLLSPFIGLELEPKNCIGLIISGGHTELYHIKSIHDYTLLGSTKDDAVGEAFDKVAKMLELGYPGGPKIEELSIKGDEEAIQFPRPMIQEKSCDFSFSGLKTAVMVYLRKNNSFNLNNVCASFQKAVLDTLISKTERAIHKTGANQLAIGGGVSCNNYLRRYMTEFFQKKGIDIFFSRPEHCTDNAAMIGFTASKYIQKGLKVLDREIDANPNLSLKGFHSQFFNL